MTILHSGYVMIMIHVIFLPLIAGFFYTLTSLFCQAYIPHILIIYKIINSVYNIMTLIIVQFISESNIG